MRSAEISSLLQILRQKVDKARERSAFLVAFNKNDLKVYDTKERAGALPKEIMKRFWD